MGSPGCSSESKPLRTYAERVRDSPVVQRVALMALVSAVAGILVAGLLVPVVGGVGLLAKAGANTFENLPTDLKIPPLPQRSRVLAADGSLLATFYDEDRVAVPLAAIPVTMRKAIVAIEDNRFYTHHGVDLKGIIRAALHNTSTGSVTQGASTLTQQYVRLVLEESKNKEEQRAAHAPTLARKLREAAYAIGLEKQLSKDQILDDYLNIAYFGDGAYGVEAAARHYFGIHVGRLSLAQAALLAGLVQNPSAYDPRLHPVAAKDRRDVVLDQMSRYGDITAEQAVAAKATPIVLHVRTAPN